MAWLVTVLPLQHISEFRFSGWPANYIFFFSFPVKCLWIIFTNRRVFLSYKIRRITLPIETMSVASALKKYV